MDNKASVAVVDDEPVIVRTYELLLKRRNIPLAFSAYDGMEAIAKFKNASPKPKVVIVDYRMRSMSGIDVLKAILKEEPGTRILLISGDGDARQPSLDAGADIFLKKPARIDEIMEAVNTLLAK